MQVSATKLSQIFLGFVVVLNLGLLIYWGVTVQQHMTGHAVCDHSDHELINQSLGCDNTYSLDKSSFASLNNNLIHYINDKTEDGTLVEASVYARDLYNGPTLGINSAEKFSPASLLKLPLLITYLDLAEDDPELLGTEIAYTPPANELVQFVPPSQEIEAGTPYSIDELLQRMISYSDNRAYYALLQYLRQISPDVDILLQTYIGLGIVDPNNLYDETVSTRSYASIFHQLFHSSYFGHQSTSEKALEYLTDTDFNQGLVAGVPAGISVAHKFGERLDEESDALQLHDCGIIYYPDNPYSLCVMTRGEDVEDLQEVIAEISRRVYAEFDRRDY